MIEQQDGPRIGTRLWRFDENRRIYRKDESGRAIGGPIWREHWVPMVITGETRQSWLINYWNNSSNRPGMHVAMKVRKRDITDLGFAFSEEDIDRREYVESHRHSLSDRVRQCRDYDTLKEIERLLEAAESGSAP